MKKTLLRILFVLLVAALLLAACMTPQEEARQQAQQIATNRNYYIPHNDVEARNYNWRLEVSDDPNTIVWCTYFPPTAGLKPITVPIMGKLTSGGKRPFPDAQGSLENADAQGMYGSSGDYRFGFGPGGKNEYYDFYQNTMCTTVPLVYQAKLTVIVSEKDPTLTAASEQAKQLLAQGDSVGAQAVLDQAISQLQGE